MTKFSSHPLIAHQCLSLSKLNQKLEAREAQVTQPTKVILPDQGRSGQTLDLRQEGEGSRMDRELPAPEKRHRWANLQSSWRSDTLEDKTSQRTAVTQIHEVHLFSLIYSSNSFPGPIIWDNIGLGPCHKVMKISYRARVPTFPLPPLMSILAFFIPVAKRRIGRGKGMNNDIWKELAL